ncbi:MAG: hypothetical protein Kapaf2KO_07340 [Candidatus Kapaibacteriales bacterium]
MRINSRHDTWHARFRAEGQEYRFSTGILLNGLSPKNLDAALYVAEEEFKKKNGMYAHLVEEEKDERDIFWLFKQYFDDYASEFTKPQRNSRILAIKSFFPDSLPLSEDNIYKSVVESRNNLNIQPQTLRKKLSYINTIFDWAVGRRYISYNPLKDYKITVPKAKTYQAAIFTEEEMDRLRENWQMDYKTSRRIYLKARKENKGKEVKFRLTHPKERFKEYMRYFRILDLTGMRPGELAKAECKDVSEKGFYVRYGKNEDRYLPYNDNIYPGLKEILESQKYTSRAKRLFPFIQIKDMPNGWHAILSIANNIHKTLCLSQGVTVNSLKTIRATTLNRWEKKLGLPPDLIDDLGGNSDPVRKTNYKSPKNLGDMATKLSSRGF